MKKVLCLILCSLFLGVSAFASDSVINKDKQFDIRGWSVFGTDDDIDAAYELITELDTTYAQLAAEDTIEVLSSDAADITQTVTVKGIDNSGNKVSEEIALNTTAGTTVVTSSTTWRYIDQVSVDIECAGVITVRRATGDTFITSIPIGVLEATMVQHFNGEYRSFVTGWRASCTSTTGTVILDLRWYPDDADCLDAGDGFIVLDQIVFTNVLGTQERGHLDAIECPAGGWIAVYALGGAANSDASVTIQGYDQK